MLNHTGHISSAQQTPVALTLTAQPTEISPLDNASTITDMLLKTTSDFCEITSSGILMPFEMLNETSTELLLDGHTYSIP